MPEAKIVGKLIEFPRFFAYWLLANAGIVAEVFGDWCREKAIGYFGDAYFYD